MTGTEGPVGPRFARGRRAALALGVTVAVVAVVATPLLLRGGGSSPAAAASSLSSTSAIVEPSVVSSRTPSTVLSVSPVLAEGATVEATGRIVSVPGKPARLCAPVPISAVGYVPGKEPAPAWCPVGVDVTGVDLTALQTPRTKEGATEGYGYVRGVYRNGTVAVSVQTAERASAPTYSNLVTPPCPVPAGGWHRETRGSNPLLGDKVSAYGQSHAGQIESLAIFRPNGTTGVVVAAVTDLAAAVAGLPVDPASLCLVASRYTAAQVSAAQAPFVADQTAHSPDGKAQVVTVGQGVGPDGQSLVEVQVVAMTAQVVQWAAQAPVGLVDLIPWIGRVTPDAPLPELLATGDPTVSPASAALYASEDAAYPSTAPSSLG